MDHQTWVEYLLRFSHLVAGIAWVGSSFYFIWLDASFEPPTEPRRNVEGELFMVHGGFYYQVEKRKIFPGELPKTLHWFKWEATLTWLTGLTLFVVLYWLRGASLLVDPAVRTLTQGEAIGLSVAILVTAWVVYDLIWHPKWMSGKSALSLVLSALSFTGLVYGLTRVFSGRGAFIMTGAALGTAMLLNVWMRILPGQRKMLREAEAGQIPDGSMSGRSKTRSVHNTYFTFPVLFIMLSNHYPVFYSHRWNWLLLMVLALSGAMIRHAMVAKRPRERWVLAPAAFGLLGLVFVTGARPAEPTSTSTEKVELVEILRILEKRCWACHSSKPTDEVFKVAPSGIIFESETQLRARADRIKLHVVTAKSMPLGNKTQMTDEERRVFGRWLEQPAP
ncbi:MAG: urate hydroxylase PuuD [Deltaproteobacteria bacterium]|nr:urate hydroxylase PuuD [Deltaproteobacteria bacterium]